MVKFMSIIAIAACIVLHFSTSDSFHLSHSLSHHEHKDQKLENGHADERRRGRFLVKNDKLNRHVSSYRDGLNRHVSSYRDGLDTERFDTFETSLIKDRPVSRDTRNRKRSISVIAGAGITPGRSLKGTSVSALMAKGFSVAVAGSVENHSRWTMIFQYCTTNTGKINKPMKNVYPGKKEGFASHKTSWSTHGTSVYCLYKVNDKLIHIMYSVPYTYWWGRKNWLSLAITPDNVHLDFKKMYKNKYPTFMARKAYKSSVHPTMVCNRGFCIKGTMGTSHKTFVHVKLYPSSYKNVASSVKKAIKSRGVENGYKLYDRFIKNEFNLFSL